MIIDLHSHTTASDGSLSPAELLERARQLGVGQLAITDHDTVAGLQELGGISTDPRLVPGVELSCVWGKSLIHVVGLQIDPAAPALYAGLEKQQSARRERAHLIADKLERFGFEGAYEGAASLAGEGQIGRPHFARYLVDQGYVTSEKEAFKKYLGSGKPGDVKLVWPALSTVVEWISQSDGIPVLAHPLHYPLTQTRLRGVIADFIAAGGVALEVINGRQTEDKTRQLAALADRFDLLASVGSDFHRPGLPWSELGQVASLPARCRPVWSLWE